MILRPKRRDDPDLNITPLIDVVFLLLIFFMVSTTFDKQAELNIELPEASGKVTMTEQFKIEISIDGEGRYFVNQRRIKDDRLVTLKRAIELTLGENKETLLVAVAQRGASTAPSIAWREFSAEAEPEIYATTQRWGSVLENVVVNPETGVPDFDDGSLTENGRVAYPMHFIPNASETAMGPHPKNVIMLTADAFGVLPPIAKLTPSQAMYHFLSGYTAKVAGTEKGVAGTQATFSMSRPTAVRC